MAHLVGVVPRSPGFPAWVVANEYGRLSKVWDENGALLAEIPSTANDSVYGVVDWQDGRALVLGGASARGRDLDGHTLFDVPLGEFFLSQALAVRLAPGARPHLAIAAGAPRDLKRARLLLVSPEREIVYDEILEKPVRLLAAAAPTARTRSLSAGTACARSGLDRHKIVVTRDHSVEPRDYSKGNRKPWPTTLSSEISIS